MKKKKKVEKVKRICYKCSKNISPKDQYVFIGTYNRIEKPDDEQFFHFQCFVEWFNEKVSQKMKVLVKAMQEQTQGLMQSPLIAGIIQNLQGSDLFMSMLNKPLYNGINVPKKKLKKQFKMTEKEKVKKTIQDDRKRKRSGKKKKTVLQEM